MSSARAWPTPTHGSRGPVVQVGMDTPHVTAELLLDAAAGLDDHDAVLGPAEDGGWWVLALRRPAAAASAAGGADVHADDLLDTRAALAAAGLDVGTTDTLRDVDEVADADAVALLAPGSRFAAAWWGRRMSVQDRLPEGRASFSDVFSAALRGRPCTVVGLGREPQALPVELWRREADAEDLALLALCRGHTVDLGCGPGRLTAALARLGHVVLGVDVVREAVDQTLARGVSALRRDVFDRLPGEGRWRTALLADGNVGIGGDPVALLQPGRRAGAAPRAGWWSRWRGPGVPTTTRWAVLTCAGVRSAPFRWSTVGVDDIADLARRAGYATTEVHRIGERRWCAVLGRSIGRPRIMEG